MVMQQLWIQICDKTAADRDMVTIICPSELVIAQSNGAIANPLYDLPFTRNSAKWPFMIIQSQWFSSYNTIQYNTRLIQA